MKVIRYARHRPHILYETTLLRHLVLVGVVIGIAIALAAMLAHFAYPKNDFDINAVSMHDILIATVNTFYRMLLAYVFSMIVSVPLALGMASSPRVQKVTLPVADILQSVPVLAFFPVVVVFFTAHHQFEFSAVFIIFLSMMWNIVFPVVSGLHTIPDDIKSAAIVFNVCGFKKFWNITLPAIFPFLVTGSFLAWAQGWTIVIVAEVLHTYIPGGTLSQDLLGLGSLLVDSNAQGKNGTFVATLTVMIILITLLNLAVWQPLINLSQRFRFD